MGPGKHAHRTHDDLGVRALLRHRERQLKREPRYERMSNIFVLRRVQVSSQRVAGGRGEEAHSSTAKCQSMHACGPAQNVNTLPTRPESRPPRRSSGLGCPCIVHQSTPHIQESRTQFHTSLSVPAASFIRLMRNIGTSTWSPSRSSRTLFAMPLRSVTRADSGTTTSRVAMRMFVCTGE
jgi:hypothetical protein